MTGFVRGLSQARFRLIRHFSVGSLLTAGAAGAASVVLSVQLSDYRRPIRAEYFFDTSMVAEGRPGNLTAQQTKALKELWASTLQVFGRPINGKDTSAKSSTLAVPNANGIEAEKPKMRRGLSGMLGIRSKSPSNNSEDSLVDEDKWSTCKEYQEAINSQSPDELRQVFWRLVKADNPDALLLRFLRARKWNVNNAMIMMIATMHWRVKEINVEKILFEGEEGALGKDEAFLNQMRVGKSFFHGTDKQGRPICYVRVRLHKPKEQTDETIEKFTVWVMETGRLMLKPPVDTACVVFDMSDFAIANMDYNPVKFIVKCFEAHYPESLGVLLIHRAPWVFQGVWNIIKGWLDPVVASKIQFTRTLTDLGQFIEPSEIIKELGGPNDWSYEYPEPVVGENESLKDDASRQKLMSERRKCYESYEDLTTRWVNSDGEEGQALDKERKKLADGLARDYWELDKYVRAKTLYDRTGVIGPNGEYHPHGSQK